MALEQKMNLLQVLEQEELARVTAGKTIPDFRAGDTVVVSVNVVEATGPEGPLLGTPYVYERRGFFIASETVFSRSSGFLLRANIHCRWKCRKEERNSFGRLSLDDPLFS